MSHSLFDAGPIPMEIADLDYVLGAFLERRSEAQAEGLVYTLTDFIRDALLNASHR